MSFLDTNVKRGITVALGAAAVTYLLSRLCQTNASGHAGPLSPIDASDPLCYALVFAKPHAHLNGGDQRVVQFIKASLSAAGLTIVATGTSSGPDIARDGTIDKHYRAIAAYALYTDPASLPINDKVKADFLAKYGVSWANATSSKRVLKCDDAANRLNLSPEEFIAVVDAARPTGMRLGPGCYVSQLTDSSKGDTFWVVNGFYTGMRSEYVRPSARVTWFVVSWPERKLSWKSFRADVVGATDPNRANPSSVRRQILIRSPELGLPFSPSTGNNCVHGSASGLEALNERMIWTPRRQPENDPFGQWLLGPQVGLTRDEVDWCLTNPLVTPPGEPGGAAQKPLFDLVEDATYAEMAAALRQVVRERRG